MAGQPTSANLRSTEDSIMTDVLSLLESEPTSAPDNVLAVASTQPGIPALREQLATLVSAGKTKETIGVLLTHEQVKRLSDKDVEKYFERYEVYVSSKTNDTLLDSFLTFASKIVGNFLPIKDVEALRNELKNDYIITKQLANLAGNLSLKCGRLLAVANAALVTAKHIDFESTKKIPNELTIDSSPIPEDSAATAE